ncbi:uncharacterized protein LAESUDRAFT_727798 [Laetiporus sulphureus 93-53]|uniref:Amidohydrolase 3 domain-containing protein n=1 Tax=Laetiporus sulphureus 93-53 TaxID=1314785 RepID=A0A165DDD6_9APHY|nr:uncharacterized protein LAESUDRAFT_727798 [Laetiporus sulphureus 93-53]KZT04626.1 hypothetical protein LAESUDRAFT_727798 [Laetiporus sulphureus 93-53]
MPPLCDCNQILRRRTPSEEKKTPEPPFSGAAPATRHLFGVSRTSRLCLLIVSVALSLYFFVQRPSSDDLPGSYAVCSPSGAYIYTADDTNTRVQCLVVHRSHFVDTGSLDDVRRRWSEATRQSKRSDNALPRQLEIRYIKPGQVVLPGLSDSHAHILEYGAMKQMPMEDARTVEETVRRVREYILSDPDLKHDKTKFVEGWGWDHTNWERDDWPSFEHLEADPVVAGRPIVLQSKDGHALWVSSLVLQSMEPLPDEVEGGAIIRNSSGRALGVFLDNAQELVKRPIPTYKALEKRFAATVRDALSHGLTTIHDAGFDPMSLNFFRRQADEGRLPIRIYGMTYFDESAEYWGDNAVKVLGAGDNRLWARSVKIFADGALRSGGAALYAPYADNPDSRGLMRIEPEVLKTVIPRFMRDGWQVNVHAIGDRANGMVLDAFEEALKHANVTALRPRLEHAQILAEADMARFGDLGVIASIQPTHAISDMWFGEERLGPERVKGLYAFRSILDHGARITLGSDSPVEEINPLAGFYAAVTRLSKDGRSPHGPGGWFPEQRMTREEALRGMTIDPAYASFTDGILGSVTAGKRADYVILSQDIMTIPPENILDARVVATVIDGRLVYGMV